MEHSIACWLSLSSALGVRLTPGPSGAMVCAPLKRVWAGLHLRAAERLTGCLWTSGKDNRQCFQRNDKAMAEHDADDHTTH